MNFRVYGTDSPRSARLPLPSGERVGERGGGDGAVANPEGDRPPEPRREREPVRLPEVAAREIGVVEPHADAAELMLHTWTSIS